MMDELLQYTVNGIAIFIMAAGGYFVHQNIRPWLKEQVALLKATRDHQEIQVLFDLAGKAVMRAEQTLVDNSAKKAWAVSWVEQHAAEMGYNFDANLIADAVEAMVHELLKLGMEVLGNSDVNFVVQRNMELQSGGR